MTVYETVKKALKLSWKNDDLMEQDDLFEVQDLLAKAVLAMAVQLKKEEEIQKEFPWLFKKKAVK